LWILAFPKERRVTRRCTQKVHTHGHLTPVIKCNMKPLSSGPPQVENPNSLAISPLFGSPAPSALPSNLQLPAPSLRFRFATHRKTGFAVIATKQTIGLIPVRNIFEEVPANPQGQIFDQNLQRNGLPAPSNRYARFAAITRRYRSSFRYNRNMPIRMIAMDLDGTLLDSASQVSEENQRAISEAADRGIEIVLVTGRRFDFARPIAERLPVDLHLISSNGAVIKSLDGATLYRSTLPAATARAVVEFTRQFREFCAVVFDRPKERQIIMERVDWDDPLRGAYFRKSRDFLAVVNPLENCLDGHGAPEQQIENPIQVAFSGSVAAMRSVYSLLQSFPNAADFTIAFTEYEKRDLSILDVLAPGVTKAAGLAEWACRRGIAREEIMAIGDNWNDAEMLDFAGFPVIMGNAVDELKSRGWAVTRNNDEHGVAEAIRRHALREHEVPNR